MSDEPTTGDQNGVELTDEDRLILDSLDGFYADGLALKKWWEQAEAADGFTDTFEVVYTLNRPDSSRGFFGEAPLDRGTMPVMGVVDEVFYDQPKAAVKPADLSVVALRKNPIPENDAARPTTGRRLALARRLTDGTHPLTARVLVNRFWLHPFGRGLDVGDQFRTLAGARTVEPCAEHRDDLKHVPGKILFEAGVFALVQDYDLDVLRLTDREDELGAEAQQTILVSDDQSPDAILDNVFE